MRKIKKLVDQIKEELEGAKDYAESYVECKAKGNSVNANRYKEMATQELNHANIIHEIAVKEIEEISKVFVPPLEMEEAWEKSHKAFIEETAWIKQMLSM